MIIKETDRIQMVIDSPAVKADSTDVRIHVSVGVGCPVKMSSVVSRISIVIVCCKRPYAYV